MHQVIPASLAQRLGHVQIVQQGIGTSKGADCIIRIVVPWIEQVYSGIVLGAFSELIGHSAYVTYGFAE